MGLPLIHGYRHARAHVLGKRLVEMGDDNFRPGVGPGPHKAARLHALLHLRHVPEILLEHVRPTRVGGIGDELPLRLRLSPLRITFDHVGFEDTAIGVRAVRPRAVAERVRHAVQDNTVGEEMPVVTRLLHVIGIDVRPDDPHAPRQLAPPRR